MSTTSHTASTTRDTFLCAHAASLIAYAESDALFAQSLAAQVQSLKFLSFGEGELVLNLTTELVPDDREQAVRVARWLLGQVKEHKATLMTETLLSEWASDYTAPKDLIIGIVGVEIMGPTLGILNKKKKKKSQLQIVINRDHFTELDHLTLTQEVIRWSQQLMARELRLVGGNVHRMHPDSADWFLSDPQTSLYLIDGDSLKDQLDGGLAEGLSLVGVTDQNDRLVAVAVSPCVNDSFVTESDAEALEYHARTI